MVCPVGGGSGDVLNGRPRSDASPPNSSVHPRPSPCHFSRPAPPITRPHQDAHIRGASGRRRRAGPRPRGLWRDAAGRHKGRHRLLTHLWHHGRRRGLAVPLALGRVAALLVREARDLARRAAVRRARAFGPRCRRRGRRAGTRRAQGLARLWRGRQADHRGAHAQGHAEEPAHPHERVRVCVHQHGPLAVSEGVRSRSVAGDW